MEEDYNEPEDFRPIEEKKEEELTVKKSEESKEVLEEELMLEQSEEPKEVLEE
jgi:hypothetical protein